MTSTPQAPPAGRPTAIPPKQESLLRPPPRERRSIVVQWITSTDHKTIGYLYIIAALLFFLLAGLMALMIRAELFAPGMQIIPTKQQYNELFTMHGTIMLLMFATPLFAGFANAVMPLQIGAPDVAFPRLNALSFWLFLFGSLLAVSGFFSPGGAPGFGWTAYQPLSSVTFQPGVYATIAIAALSVAVWAHHMFATGAVLLPFFSLLTVLIAVPTGVKIFNWIGTMWRGSVTFETPMVFVLGFIITFVFGGLTGVILASPPLDFHVHDSYFVVAHFHYVVFGTVVFAMFAGFYFWWPKWTGRMLDERLGMVHFWMLFIGFHTTFLIQHWLGADGMPRRYADYSGEDGFTWQNQVSTLGAMILGASMLPFLLNVWLTARKGARVTVDDPWGYGASLEWATSCPPPRHNFTSIPRIRSERPAFDLHHPDAGLPVGVGPAKDAPDTPVEDVGSGDVK